MDDAQQSRMPVYVVATQTNPTRHTLVALPTRGHEVVFLPSQEN